MTPDLKPRTVENLQTCLFVAALVAALLPWQYSAVAMVEEVRITKLVGWQLPVGHFLIALLVTNYAIAVLSRRYSMDVVFFHRSIFIMSLLSAGLAPIKGLGIDSMGTKWGYYVFLMISLIYYAVAGARRIPSPTVAATEIQP